MDDLIRRQNAISTVMAWTVDNRPDILVDRLNAIPSAQRWIPCSEQLPNKLDAVLMTDYDNWIDIGYYVKGSGWHYRDLVGTPEKVLAWMPLPGPYKEEE